MTAEMGLVRPETLRHQVENALRQAITSGRFAPGARLIERSPQGASLTVAGATLLEYVERIESETLQAGDHGRETSPLLASARGYANLGFWPLSRRCRPARAGIA